VWRRRLRRRLEQPFVSAYTLGLRRLRPVGGGSLGSARKYTICAVVLQFVPVIVLFHFETRSSQQRWDKLASTSEMVCQELNTQRLLY
jgi:hypothetical protein